MSEQFTIDGGAEPLEKPDLGPRQQLVVKALEERGGLDADEVGAIVHAWRGKHSEDLRCDWCAREGNDVLRSLRGRGLVRRKRGQPWTLAGADLRPDLPGPGDLPESF